MGTRHHGAARGAGVRPRTWPQAPPAPPGALVSLPCLLVPVLAPESPPPPPPPSGAVLVGSRQDAGNLAGRRTQRRALGENERAVPRGKDSELLWKIHGA